MTDPGGLTRHTFNATGRTNRSLDALIAASGDNKTDAINGAIRLAATLLTYARDDGTVHVLAPDGTTHVVHLP
ncbi:hypothetical protein ACFQY4_35180 [Catellatospora bangladeshensis]|uniref:Uncharacterized protein n=1 Tax=Catellatospora bangladeshensis TaxID=310355 RepID=A0A8J3NIY3_9ACTN|nr:hypothetical protein [Catellatospora bangladeshensis]GIF80891.1 hypothetical protein Cba03nite_22400 [Catellatospora bangladeshensis]